MLRAAKETISLAEQRLLEDDKRQFDSAWQEMLNHATQRVRAFFWVIWGEECLFPSHLSPLGILGYLGLETESVIL